MTRVWKLLGVLAVGALGSRGVRTLSDWLGPVVLPGVDHTVRVWNVVLLGLALTVVALVVFVLHRILVWARTGVPDTSRFTPTLPYVVVLLLAMVLLVELRNIAYAALFPSIWTGVIAAAALWFLPASGDQLEVAGTSLETTARLSSLLYLLLSLSLLLMLPNAGRWFAAKVATATVVTLQSVFVLLSNPA